MAVETIETMVQYRDVRLFDFFEAKISMPKRKLGSCGVLNSKAVYIMQTFLSSRNTVNKTSKKMLAVVFILFYSNFFNLNVKGLLTLCTSNW